MADGVFNNVKGEFKTLAALPAASDALIVTLVETTGLEAEDTLNNYDDLAALYTASNNEPAGGTYARKTVTASITVTVDDTNNRVDVDMPDLTWTALTTTGNNPISRLLVNYDNDTGAGTDSNIRPCTYHDFVITPDGSDVVAVIATSGFYRAQ
jgi:hypothetical protein